MLGSIGIDVSEKLVEAMVAYLEGFLSLIL